MRTNKAKNPKITPIQYSKVYAIYTTKKFLSVCLFLLFFPIVTLRNDIGMPSEWYLEFLSRKKEVFEACLRVEKCYVQKGVALGWLRCRKSVCSAF